MTFNSREQSRISRGKLRIALLCSLLAHGFLLLLNTSKPEPVVSASLVAHLNIKPSLAKTSQTMASLASALSAQPQRPVHANPAHQEVPVLTKSLPAPIARSPVEKAPLLPLGQVLSENSDSVPSKQPAIVAESVTAMNAASLNVADNGSTPGGMDSQREQKATSSPAEGVSADGLRRYRLSLATQARRFKRYPAQALAAGWVGTVEIFLAVDSMGRAAATLNKSSGHEVLDRAAQAMIEAGAERAPVPDTLQGKAFSLVLPVVFNLNDS